jgi:hypothetical protein
VVRNMRDNDAGKSSHKVAVARSARVV